MSTILSIEGLRKTFSQGFIPRRKEILKGISFAVSDGEIFGYLGPNGAGKTTTIKCVLGLIFPDAGRIELCGRPHLDPRSKEKVGFLPENPYFYDHLTAREFLDFYGQLFGLAPAVRRERIRALLKLVDMERAADLSLRKYSRGMLQRVGLAQALINEPSLVVLDEPLGGLDPIGRKEVRDIILRMRDEGRTVVLSSHILQDIEMICDRVAVIVDGRVISQGALHDLISEKVLYTEATLSGFAPQDLAGFGEPVSVRGDRVFLMIYEEARVDALLALCQAKGCRIHSRVPRTETLEDIFVEMVKRG